jgi:hypothetical protein
LSCNAFVAKHTKKDLRDRLDSDIAQNQEKYPEIIALNWVLEQNEKVTFSFRDKVKFELARFFNYVKGLFK